LSKPVYVLPRGADTDDIVNITTLAVVDAQEQRMTEAVEEWQVAPVAAD